MPNNLLLIVIIALAGLLVMTLIVVAIANSLSRTPAMLRGSRPHIALVTATSKRRQARSDARAASETAKKAQKQAGAIVVIVLTLVALLAGVAVLKKMNNGAIMPEISEITAGELHGTMINARNSDPVVLIVPGSGPTDRDGNSPMGMKTDAYKLLAEALAEERISTVRVDKRGMFTSAGAGDPNITSPHAYVEDIHAWIDAIKTERGSKCVFLLGHSEGALMVSLAAEGRKDVCGLILVSGMGRKMGDVIREQLTSNPANAPILDQALGALSSLEAGQHVDVTGMHPALLPLFNPKVQDYLISMFAIDPVDAVRKAKQDTLIVQGERDMQVSVADARLLDAAPKTKLRLLGQMNHVLKDAPEDRAGNLATYTDPSLPLAKDLVKYIRRFVKDND